MLSNISSWISHGILLFAIRYIVSFFPIFFFCFMMTNVLFCWYLLLKGNLAQFGFIKKILVMYCEDFNFEVFLHLLRPVIPYPYRALLFIISVKVWVFLIFLLFFDFYYEIFVHLGNGMSEEIQFIREGFDNTYY